VYTKDDTLCLAITQISLKPYFFDLKTIMKPKGFVTLQNAARLLRLFCEMRSFEIRIHNDMIILSVSV